MGTSPRLLRAFFSRHWLQRVAALLLRPEHVHLSSRYALSIERIFCSEIPVSCTTLITQSDSSESTLIASSNPIFRLDHNNTRAELLTFVRFSGARSGQRAIQVFVRF